MQSWQKFIETKNPMNENQAASLARMAADACMRAAGSPENQDYFRSQCQRAMEYLQQAVQAKPDLNKEREKLMKAYQRGIITDEEMEQRLAQLGA